MAFDLDGRFELAQRADEIEQIEAQIRQLDSDRATMQFGINTLKANVTVDESQLQDAIAAGDAAAERRLGERLDELRAAYELRLRHGLAAVSDVHQRVRDPQARASWRTGTGKHRNVGALAPEGSQPAEPTLEDAYLLLLGSDARTTGVAA